MNRLALLLLAVGLFWGCAREGRSASQLGLPPDNGSAAASTASVTRPVSALPTAPFDTVNLPSVAQLLQGSHAREERVRFVGTVLRVHECPACDPEIQCKPCDVWVAFADSSAAAPTAAIVLSASAQLDLLHEASRYVCEAQWLVAPSQSVQLRAKDGHAEPAAAELQYVGCYAAH